MKTMRVIFAKTASSSARNQKTFWKRICVRKILHKFFLCTPNLWFWHPWLTFLSEQKKTHKVINKAQNVKFTFINFFSKCALDTWNAPLTTLRNHFRRKTDVFVQWPKTLIQIVLLPEIFLKMVFCTGRLRFWE